MAPRAPAAIRVAVDRVEVGDVQRHGTERAEAAPARREEAAVLVAHVEEAVLEARRVPVGEDAVDPRAPVAGVLGVRPLAVAEHHELAGRDPVAVVARVRERRVPAPAAPEQPQLPALLDRVRVGVAEATGDVRADLVDRAPVVDRMRRDRHPVAHLALLIPRQEVPGVRGEEDDEVAVGPEHERRVVVVVAPEPAVDQLLAQLAGLGEAGDPHVAGRRDPAGERVAVMRDRARVAEVRPRARAQLTIRHIATLRLAARLGQVLLAGLDQDRLALDLVAHRHDALGDLGQRARARVLYEPLRAAHGRRAVLAAGTERAGAIAPQLARLRLLLRSARAPAATGRQRLVQRQVRRAAGLRDLEDAVIELGRLPRLRGQLDDAVLGVDSRAERDALRCVDLDELVRPGLLHQHLAADRLHDDPLPGHGRRLGRWRRSWAGRGCRRGLLLLWRRHGEAPLHRLASDRADGERVHAVGQPG